MTKIYIVQAESGSYDSHIQWNHSVHTEEAKAIKEAERINLEWKEKLDIPPPFPVDEDGLFTICSQPNDAIEFAEWYLKRRIDDRDDRFLEEQYKIFKKDSNGNTLRK